MTPKEKALLHIYPQLARISEADRRNMLQRSAGVVSAGDPALTQTGFERAMALYETVLWDRVDRGLAPDPRACPVCSRVMKPGRAGMGECPEGCGARKVYAWSRDYWRKKLPSSGQANSRCIHKLRQLWAIIMDYLPEDQRTDAYLAGILYHAQPARHRPESPKSMLESGGVMAWQRLTMTQSLVGIEALKDRLSYAVR